MSNKRKTEEQRIEQMRKNSTATLAYYDALDSNNVKLSLVDQRRRYKASRQLRKAGKLHEAMRRRQLEAFQTHMQKEMANG